jgi:hypothetical protein
MNIFYLDHDVEKCAREHNDKHVVKMILEYGQLMSTAHRVLDGYSYLDKTSNGRKIKRWRLDDEREEVLWKASHVNHPSGVWARANGFNYMWLKDLWIETLKEYTYRYGKAHSAERMRRYFVQSPRNISWNSKFYQPTPAMPDKYIIEGDSVTSYRNYYIGHKQHLASWKKREIPEWFTFEKTHADI